MKKLKAKSDERQEWNLPSVPDDYISALLWGQLDNSQEAYAKARPRWLESQHRYETLEEITIRVGETEDKEYNNKRIRQGQARVSLLSMPLCTLSAQNFTETAMARRHHH